MTFPAVVSLLSIIDPNVHKCTTCPKGLTCQGTAEYTAVVSGSTWRAVNGTLKLQSCPDGYQMVTPVNERDQECAPCSAGYECVTRPCTLCTPCRLGHYKDSASNGVCGVCPKDTYNEKNGSQSPSDCTPCGANALTNGTGKTSVGDCTCTPCLTAGDWCSRASYNLLNSNSTDSACQVCPEGAECNGFSLRTKNNLQGANWVVDGKRYSLKSCPTGHRCVNNLGYEKQKCEPCGPSEYILKSDDPSYQCLPCPARSDPMPWKSCRVPPSPILFVSIRCCLHTCDTLLTARSAPTEDRPSKL